MRGSFNVMTHAQSGPSAAPQLGSCASSGRAWRLWLARSSQGEAQPLGVSPLPRLLERAAPKAAGFPAFDHPGLAGVLWTPTAALLADRYGWRWALGAVAAMQWCSDLALSPPC